MIFEVRTCGPSGDSYQLTHWRSVLRIFTGFSFSLDNQRCHRSPCGKIRLSDCMEAQIALALPLAHMSEGTFSHDATIIVLLSI